MDLLLVIGLDGLGIVIEIGEGVLNIILYIEVIINFSIGWEYVIEVLELLEVLGGLKDGMFVEYVIVLVENVVEKLLYFIWEELGVLFLFVLIVYRVFFIKGRLKCGEYVLILGIGGGVVIFVMLFVKVIGVKVSVILRVENKREFVEKYGVDIFFNSIGNWEESL